MIFMVSASLLLRYGAYVCVCVCGVCDFRFFYTGFVSFFFSQTRSSAGLSRDMEEMRETTRYSEQNY